MKSEKEIRKGLEILTNSKCRSDMPCESCPVKEICRDFFYEEGSLYTSQIKAILKWVLES